MSLGKRVTITDLETLFQIRVVPGSWTSMVGALRSNDSIKSHEITVSVIPA